MKPISKWICDDGDEEKMWLLLDIKINIRGSQASLRLKTVVCPNEYYHLTTSVTVFVALVHQTCTNRNGLRHRNPSDRNRFAAIWADEDLYCGKWSQLKLLFLLVG